MVSCIFTLTDDLDAEFPAVAARALGLDRVPLLCAREVPVPGSLPRVIRVLVHYYAPEDHVPRHVYLRRRARAARRSRSGTIASDEHRVRRSASGGSRATRSPPATTSATTSRCSPPTSRASGRRREVRRGGDRARSGGANRYPDPSYSPLRRALADRYGVAAGADRARQRLLRPAARGRRGAAGARRRARLRMAGVQRLRALPAALRRARDPRPARRRASATTSRRWPPR